jgi:glycosyltransferase involved in cell wall biosynthesis
MELSVIICTRNRARQLAAALNSLDCLSTRREWEVVVVDNASTDDTAEVIRQAAFRQSRIRYAREERIGLGAARNCGWRQARGRLLAFTDDDCYLTPSYVDAVIHVFEEHPQIGFVGGRILPFDPEDLPLAIDLRLDAVDIAPRKFVPAGAVQGANLSFRRETLERIGGFDPELGAGTAFPCEDIDAAAAALWVGIPGRYDPTSVVLHHHGRRAFDLPRVSAAYDWGRGAYYMKYILRPDSRRAYLWGWARGTHRRLNPQGLARLSREMHAALAYLKIRRHVLIVAALATIGAALYAAIAATAHTLCLLRAIVRPRLRP